MKRRSFLAALIGAPAALAASRLKHSIDQANRTDAGWIENARFELGFLGIPGIAAEGNHAGSK